MVTFRVVDVANGVESHVTAYSPEAAAFTALGIKLKRNARNSGGDMRAKVYWQSGGAMTLVKLYTAREAS